MAVRVDDHSGELLWLEQTERLRAKASAADVVPSFRQGSRMCVSTVFVALPSTPRQHRSPSIAEQVIECCF